MLVILGNVLGSIVFILCVVSLSFTSEEVASSLHAHSLTKKDARSSQSVAEGNGPSLDSDSGRDDARLGVKSPPKGDASSLQSVEEGNGPSLHSASGKNDTRLGVKSPPKGDASSLQPVAEGNAPSLHFDSEEDAFDAKDDNAPLPSTVEGEKDLPIPRHLQPLEYTLSFVVNIAGAEIFSTGSLRVKCVRETSQINLNVKDLLIEDSTVEVKKVLQLLPYRKTRSLEIVGQQEFKKQNIYMIVLKKVLQKNDMIIIDFKYKILAPPLDVNAAVVKYSYARNPDEKEKWFAVTKSSAVDAKRLFPCINKADWKVPVTVRIAHHKNLKSLSNSYENNMDNTSLNLHGKSDFVIENFYETDPLSPFSIGFVIGDFQSTEVTDFSSSPNKSIRIWADGAVINKMTFARNTALTALQFYHNHFWSIHGTNKIDIVALPNYNRVDKFRYGLITLEESLISYEDLPTDVTNQDLLGFSDKKIDIALQICDVFAQQYFGPQTTFVGERGWNDHWLHMGLVQFYRIPCFKKVFEKSVYDSTSIADVHLTESFLRVKSYEETYMHPIKCTGHLGLEDLFEDTMLAEIAHFYVRMMAFILDEKILRKCVEKYIVNFRFKVLSADQLFNICNKERAHRKIALLHDLEFIMDSWIVRQGRPLIVMIRLSDDERITLMQTSYKNNRGTIKERIIPLKLLRGKGNQSYYDGVEEHVKPAIDVSDFIFSTAPVFVHVDTDQWIILNSGLNVLCRMHYDEHTVQLLQTMLLHATEYKKIPVFSRIHLISNLFESAEMVQDDLEYAKARTVKKLTSYLSQDKLKKAAIMKKLYYWDVFNTMFYLKHEESVLPFRVAMHEFYKIRSRLFKAEDIVYNKFETYVKDILSTKFDKKFKLIEEPSPSKYEEYYFKNVLVTAACTFGIEDCVEQSVELITRWIGYERTHNPIPIEFREVINCTAINASTDMVWKQLWRTYNKKNSRNVNKSILNALACTSNEKRLKKYLNESLNPNKIAPEDKFAVFESFASNKSSYKCLFSKKCSESFLEKILKLDLSETYRYFQKLFEIVSTEEDFGMLFELKDSIDDDPQNITRYLKASMQKGMNNVFWLNDFKLQMNAITIRKNPDSFSSGWTVKDLQERERSQKYEGKVMVNSVLRLLANLTS